MNDELRPCPFCGGQPDFSGVAERDERRYMEMELECCILMTNSIGYSTYKSMDDKSIAARLRAGLVAEWNHRYEPEVAPAMPSRPSARAEPASQRSARTYGNGPGNVPRLPARVVDTLIDSAGVSRLAYDDKDQSAQVERLVHNVCEELLARLPSPAPSCTPAVSDSHESRLAIIREHGDESLIESVRNGSVSISAAVAQVSSGAAASINQAPAHHPICAQKGLNPLCPACDGGAGAHAALPPSVEGGV